MLKKAALSAAIGAMTVVAIGCALTDYGGFPGHTTQSEAKLWGKEVAFSGFGGDFDGTYSYTAKYANGYPVTINSYRNAVVGAFSRDGIVDRDGDDIQGRGGSLTAFPATPAGKFLKQWVAVDGAAGCQFFSNITFDKSALGPGIALCNNGANEEVDKDLDIQDAFASMGDLISRIWSGAVAQSFTVQLTSVTVNGTTVPLSTGVSASVTHNGLRPINMAVDLSSPGGQELLRALLSNTADKQPVTLGVGFAGGMSFTLPASTTVAFNHAALRAALK